MIKKNTLLPALSFTLFSLFIPVAQAAPNDGHMGSHGDGHHRSDMHGGKHHDSMGGHGKGHHKSGGHGKSKKGHQFTPHWAKTLTDKQKLEIDKQHLAVSQLEAVNRAKIKVLKAELGVLSANSPADKKAIYKKIDEILSLKKAIMRNRYDHIIEMREVLTPQQRISYDAGLLKRKKHKKH